MQLNISGHHVELTDALRQYVQDKFDRLNRHFERAIDAEVVLSVDNQQQKAEATVHVSGDTLFAEDSQADMYAAIDALADKLDRQLIKHKEKRQDH